MTQIRWIKDPKEERREAIKFWAKLAAEAASIVAFIALVIVLAYVNTH